MCRLVLVRSWCLAIAWACLVCASLRCQTPLQGDDGRRADRKGDTSPVVYGTSKWRHPGFVTCVAYSADGDRVISGGSEGFLRVWDRKTGAEVRAISGNAGGADVLRNAPTCVAVAPDGQTLLWGAVGGLYGCFGVEGKANHFLKMLFAPAVIAFSVDGKRAAVGSKGGDLLLWDVGKRELIHQWKIPAPMPSAPGDGLRIEAVAFSADGSRLFSGAGGAIQVWDLNSKMRVKDVPVGAGGAGAVKAMSLAPGGNDLAVGGEEFDGKILVLDAGKLEVKKSWVVRDKEDVNCLRHSADGKYLFAGLDSGVVQVFDTKTGAERAWFQTKCQAVDGIALSPKGDELAWVGLDCTVHLWDLRTMQEIQAGNGHTDGVYQVGFSPNGIVDPGNWTTC